MTSTYECVVTQAKNALLLAAHNSTGHTIIPHTNIDFITPLFTNSTQIKIVL